MPNAVLKFPVPEDPRPEETREIVFNFRPKPVLTKFSLEESKQLLVTARRVDEASQELVLFVDAHREEAVQAGIEVIAVELAAEHSNLSQVEDALEDAVAKGKEAELTLSGLALLRRLEKLVAEAGSNIARFRKESPARAAATPALGQASKAGPSDTLLLVPVIVFGVITVSLIAVAFFSEKKSDGRSP